MNTPLEVPVGTRGESSRGFINREDGKGGRNRKRNTDNRQSERYSQKVGKRKRENGVTKTRGQVQEGKHGGTRIRGQGDEGTRTNRTRRLGNEDKKQRMRMRMKDDERTRKYGIDTM